MVVQMYRVSHGSLAYQRCEDQFLDNWEHPEKSAHVEDIYLVDEIDFGRSFRGTRFNTYMEQNGGEYVKGYHGTRRACHVGESGKSLIYCDNSECNLCCILRHSFDVKHATDKGMFGRGIYATPCSSNLQRLTCMREIIIYAATNTLC
ncbi:hypothetical protein F4777DRAFT_593377 [Nemania sp. FL0916]|nr:hypothetical protein F4777DRAFT_593377 [Nemania sp. FL0916]